MNIILNEYHNKEKEIKVFISNLKGDIDTKTITIKNLKIPDSYQEIFEAYSNANGDIEALKRAIFIQWYSKVEPFFNTGIGNLNESLEKNNLKQLNNLIEYTPIDDEFKTMIVHYYTLAEWYFESIDEKLVQLIKSLDNVKSMDSITSFDSRGLMGDYWRSLEKN